MEIKLKLVSRAILLAALVKIICGQCFLNIELLQFENTYNVEIRQDFFGNEIFCCCDASSSTCEYNLNEFSSTTCPFSSPCETYFAITLAECSNIFPCPVTFITDEWSESAATVEVNYKVYFSMNSSTTQSYEFEIMMRDSDGSSFREIDTFDVTIPFASGNQDEVISGNRGIATITLSYDTFCLEPDACSTSSPTEIEETATSTLCPIATSIPIPTTTITTTDTVVQTSFTTSTQLESMTITTTTTITDVINTSSTSCPIATSVAIPTTTITTTDTVVQTSFTTSTQLELMTITTTTTITDVISTSSTSCPIATSVAIPTTIITTTDTVVDTSFTTSTQVESMTITHTINSTMVTLLTETAIVSTCTITSNMVPLPTETEIEPTCAITSTMVTLLTETAIVSTCTTTSTMVPLPTETAIGTTCAITSTMVMLLTETAIVSTCTPVTVSATPSATTVTTTIIMHASPELLVETGSTASLSDGASLAWMSLFILFFLLMVGSVMISVYLACILKKKKQNSKTNADVILVQNSAINSMTNPLYGSQECNDAELQNYCSLDNDLYTDKSESARHDYSECGPAESPIEDQNYDYIQTKQPAKIESSYDVPIDAIRSK